MIEMNTCALREFLKHNQSVIDRIVPPKPPKVEGPLADREKRKQFYEDVDAGMRVCELAGKYGLEEFVVFEKVTRRRRTLDKQSGESRRFAAIMRRTGDIEKAIFDVFGERDLVIYQLTQAGKTHIECALKLGCAPGTVGNVARRIQKELKNLKKLETVNA